jgi:hypothetical protein
MKTVIGLSKSEGRSPDLAAELQAAGFSNNRIKLFSRAAEVHSFLDGKAFADCHMCRCLVTGALIGLAFFTPVGLMASLMGCYIFGCGSLIWLFGLGGISLIGAGYGAAFACFFSADRFERDTHLYAEGVGWGRQMIAIEAISSEAADRVARVLRQANFKGIKILNNTPV